jgi:hypothetical protein
MWDKSVMLVDVSIVHLKNHIYSDIIVLTMIVLMVAMSVILSSLGFHTQ